MQQLQKSWFIEQVHFSINCEFNIFIAKVLELEPVQIF